MARTPIDVMRSLQRYFAEVLPGWEVRLDDEVQALPFCFLTRTSQVTVGADHAMFTDFSFGARAALYPGPQPTLEAALHEMGRVEAVVLAGLRRGVGLGKPNRIPLYNYDAIAKDAPATAVNRQAQDYIRLGGVTTNPVADPSDQRKQTLLVAFTVTWRGIAAGAVAEAYTGRTATSVPARRVPGGG